MVRTATPDEGGAMANASWAAVFAIAIGAFALVTTEFLPVGLLPEIARDLGVGQGPAGLMVTVPGLVAALAALLTLGAARRFDRRHVLWVLMAALVVSNAIVAMAGSFGALLVGRVLLGVAIGAFWTIGASLGPRLRAGEEGGRATAIIFSGISLGTVAGVPAGALIGAVTGWREAFWISGGLACLVTLALFLLVPSIAPQGTAGIGTLPALLRRRGIRIGVAALLLGIGGQFAAYTYIAPFLGTVTGIAAEALSAVLLAYGVAGFFGNLIGGWAAAKTVRTTLIVTLLVLGFAIAGLALSGKTAAVALACIVLWGLGYGALPVVMLNWMFGAAPDHLEGASALQVTAAQVAIGGGALLGGLAVDGAGVGGALWLGAALVLATAALIAAAERPAG